MDFDNDDEKPQPRRKTVMRLLAQGERAMKKEQVEKKAREDEEPICQLIPMPTAIKLRDLCAAFAQELPQGISELRMARIRAPKSSVGAALRDGASVDQAATHAALKALEQWVRILRPFASNGSLEGSTNLAMLVARIVHIQDIMQDDPQGKRRPSKPESSAQDASKGPFLVVPPECEPLGAAIRRIVPLPEDLNKNRWEWMEDLLSAMQYEESFDRTSVVHRSSTQSGTMRQAGESLISDVSRPKTTGQLSRRPTSQTARRNLSGWNSWAGFETTSGFRTCATHFSTPKYVRSIPGPAMYCDYDKKLSLPQTAATGVFHSVGDRRTPCMCKELSHLGRFFQQDYRVES